MWGRRAFFALVAALVALWCSTSFYSGGEDFRTGSLLAPKPSHVHRDCVSVLDLSKASMKRLQRTALQVTEHAPLSNGDRQWLTGLASSLCIHPNLSMQEAARVGTALLAATAAANQESDGAAVRACELQLAQLVSVTKQAPLRVHFYSAALSPYQNGHWTTGAALPLLDDLLIAAIAWNDVEVAETLFREKSFSFIYNSRDMDAASGILDECMLWAAALDPPLLQPSVCARARAVLLSHRFKVRGAFDAFLDNYLALVRRMRPFKGIGCSRLTLTLISTGTYRDTFALEPPIPRSHLPLLEKAQQEAACSSQVWPLSVIPKQDFGRGSTKYSRSNIWPSENNNWVVVDWQDYPAWEIHCLDHTVKGHQCIEWADVFVHGDHRTVTSPKHCTVVHSGFPFSHSEMADERFLAKPVKHLEAAVVLSFLDSNYFHMLIEDVTKLFLLKQYGMLEDMPTLLIGSAHVLDFLPLLGLDAIPSELYLPDTFIYHIGSLRMADISFGSEDIALDRHSEEFSMPPCELLTAMSSHMLSSISCETEPDTHILLVRRSTGSDRAILNVKDVRRALRELGHPHSLPLREHFSNTPLEETICLYRNAKVIVGVHGSGFANILFAKPGTHVVTVPIYPQEPSVYAMMSRCLNLVYWHVPNVAVFKHQAVSFSKEMLSSLAGIIALVLSDAARAL